MPDPCEPGKYRSAASAQITIPTGVITKGNHICQPLPPVTVEKSSWASSASTAKPAEITPVSKAPAQNTSRDFHSLEDVTSAEDRRIMPVRNTLRPAIALFLCLNVGHEPMKPYDQPFDRGFSDVFWEIV